MTPEPKRILVTGASGFIGGHVCEALLKRGAQVRAMVRRSSDLTHLASLAVEYAYTDLGDAAGPRQAYHGMDVVLHTAAAVGSFGDWEHYIRADCGCYAGWPWL